MVSLLASWCMPASESDTRGKCPSNQLNNAHRPKEGGSRSFKFCAETDLPKSDPHPPKKKKKSDTKKNIKLFFLNKSDNTFKRLTPFNGNPRKRFKGTEL